MHNESIEAWQHDHVFLGDRHDRHESRTRLVVLLSGVMMAGEIAGGIMFRSMALTADGWHMATHVAALAITLFAYRYARLHAHDARFSFGTGKLGELAGFASAVILMLVALFVGYESVMRLIEPVAIRYDEAISVAVLGLGINLLSAWLLSAGGHHDHGGHDHDHDHHDHGHHGDSNIRSAYVHVLADAFTSVLAIAALLAGYAFGLTWLDAAVGIVGACVIAQWSIGLMGTAGSVLLDAVPSPKLAGAIRERLEVEGDRVADLHLWRLGPGHMGLMVAIVADDPHPPQAYKERLGDFDYLSHVTVEVHACPEHATPRAT